MPVRDIIIRRPKIAELKEIDAFFEAVIEHTFEVNDLSTLTELKEQELDFKRRLIRCDFATGGEKRFFLIADLGGEITGTIEFGEANEVILDCSENALQDVPEIGTVFVHPKHQRQGVASLLLRALFEELQRKNIKEVCLDSGYREAQRIWSHIFGKPAYFSRDHWGEGSHHMVWHVMVEDGLERFLKIPHEQV